MSLKLFALPLYLFYIILWPVSAFTSWISKLLMRIFGVHSSNTKMGMLTVGDLNNYLTSIDRKLQELKNIIIKYFTPGDGAELLNSTLYDIFACEADLRRHCLVEDLIFVPAVQLLEEKVAQATQECASAKSPDQTDLSCALSEREKEVVACAVRGLANKQIADRLFISVNTVLTHRKNIARKLDIHSVSGLTIYAIINGIVRIEDLKSTN